MKLIENLPPLISKAIKEFFSNPSFLERTIGDVINECYEYLKEKGLYINIEILRGVIIKSIQQIDDMTMLEGIIIVILQKMVMDDE